MNDINFLEQQAIDCAINLEWNKALELNQQILKLDKKNLSAYLRLGFIYFQLNKLRKAHTTYQKVLKLQPKNQIAKENLVKIKILSSKKGKSNSKRQINLDPNLFLEITGKTKSVSLVNLGQKNILAQLLTGQEVLLKLKKRRIEIRTKNNEYIGSLPDDLSKRLILFIKAGSSYQTYVKETGLNKVVVFIKEEKKGKKVTYFTSFPQNASSNLSKIPTGEELNDEDEEQIQDNDLEKLAETLAAEEREYIIFQPEEEDSEDNEE